MAASSNPRQSGRDRRRSSIGLGASIAIAVLIVAGCGGGTSTASPASTTAVVTAPPSAPAVASATPTAVASPSASPAASQATTGRIVVAEHGFALTLPDGWTRIPVDAAGLQDFIDTLPADSELRTILEGQAGSGAQQAIKFWAFDTRDEDIAAGFARNMNIIVQPAMGVDLSAVEAAAKASLESIKSIRKPVTSKIVTLPSGEALRLDYVLDVATADGKTTSVGGTQYYLQLPKSTLIVSFSTDVASTATAAKDFDAIIKSVESSD
jgi:hypothetical protein